MNNKQWQNPYLILRLCKPAAPITFPAPPELEGYYGKVIKLPPHASVWLQHALPCDCMGSAEFEYGAIPKSLMEMSLISRSGGLSYIEISLSGSPAKSHVAGAVYSMELLKEKHVKAYLICPTEFLVETHRAISEFCKDDFCKTIRTKETVYMKTGLFGRLERNVNNNVFITENKYIGWYDLDNHWFITTSEDQYNAMKILLENKV